MVLARRIAMANNKPLRHGVKVMLNRVARKGHSLRQYGSVKRAESYIMV